MFGLDAMIEGVSDFGSALFDTGGASSAADAAAGLDTGIGATEGSSWIGDALAPAMSGILKASLMPTGGNQHATQAMSGHGVSANAATVNQGAQMITKMAGGDPLQGLQSWSNLFK